MILEGAQIEHICDGVISHSDNIANCLLYPLIERIPRRRYTAVVNGEFFARRRLMINAARHGAQIVRFLDERIRNE